MFEKLSFFILLLTCSYTIFRTEHVLRDFFAPCSGKLGITLSWRSASGYLVVKKIYLVNANSWLWSARIRGEDEAEALNLNASGQSQPAANMQRYIPLWIILKGNPRSCVQSAAERLNCVLLLKLYKTGGECIAAQEVFRRGYMFQRSGAGYRLTSWPYRWGKANTRYKCHYMSEYIHWSQL